MEACAQIPAPPSECVQLEPLVLQQLQSQFLLNDHVIPSSLIQLDDGTLLNLKSSDLDFGDISVLNNENNNKAMPKEKVRNFECDICHKKYTSKDVLRKHKKIHGVNRKFPCSKCDKGFDIQGDLEKHEEVHSGGRPYACLYCSNTFSREQGLSTHMKRYS